MSIINDAKKYHEERLKLHGEIKALADTQDNWTTEDKEKWDVVNKAYDDNKALLDESNTALKAEAEQKANIETRLAAIDNFSGDNPDDIFKRINNGSAEIGDSKLFPDPLANGGAGLRGAQGPTEEQQAYAFQAWAARDADKFTMTDKHIQSAKVCGVDLNQRNPSIVFNLNRRYSPLRDTFLPKNHGFRGSLHNAVSTSPLSAGGALFGESFVNTLEMAMLAFGGMFQTSEVIRTAGGEEMRWPTANDTSNTGIQLGENAPVSEQDPTFAQVIWNAYKFSSQEIKVSSEVLTDSMFDLPSVLGNMLGERLGRIQNTKYTNGNGAGTPNGIVTAAGAGITTSSATAIAFDEIIDLEHSLDPSRRSLSGVGYMFHDGILQVLRKLKNGTGDYLWQAGANTGAPDTLNTYPYQINQDMQSTVAASTVTMLFGQLSQYKIRQVGEVRLFRLVERHRENDQDAFLAFVRGDGNLLNAGDNPVKKMTQNA
jgi:HK97 family phage major capsid protein